MRLSTPLSSAIIALGLLGLPSAAYAQSFGDLTLRLESALAVPLTSPQDNRFGPGLSLGGKVGIPVLPELDLGPTVSFMVLPSLIDNIDPGTATMLGGYVRVKRSHNNKGKTILGAFSPWIDADMNDTITGSLQRFGWSVGAGVAFPMTQERTFWYGPFARFQSVVQPVGGHSGFDTTDDKTLIVGLSFEFGPGQSHKQPTTVVVHEVVQEIVPCPPAVGPVVKAEPTPQTEFVVRFSLDSSVLKPSQQNILDQASATIAQVCHNENDCQVEVEGYASSEGQHQYNIALSGERAQAAAHYMLGKMSKMNLRAAQFNVVGKGIDTPVGDNKTQAGRAANRRAEVVIRIVKGAK